eukprot:CAMPEP_0117020394 /NCGR_PEP_ID=MMETSP0472-20121206/15517_1 /TAXON_ID=693140 ORGANISM="Tiarina fusus, Strain LIS" /NCGR_SAMPLE_ID=MMETSP0472 /ASSEMBLY_ACC=CAM_ASM_000603 /LENGTH=246 /DNA_ID=CAMNT_0004725605 /DNA_START=29 /DNA_END=765 /DNA_ORIENTATION=+
MTVFLTNLDLSKTTKKRQPPPKRSIPKPKCRPQIKSFPVKLFGMLDAAEREGNEHIVSWHPDGLSFKVHNVASFVNVILPSHFKQTRYKSFQRQLNFYGFQRITSGPLEGSYKHGMFIKGDEALSKKIKRLANQHQSTKLGDGVAHEHHGTEYDSSSHNSETEQEEEKNNLSMQSSEQESLNISLSQESPSRRDSYNLAMEILEKSAAVVTNDHRRDSFREAIDTFATTFFESNRKKLRRGVSTEG